MNPTLEQRAAQIKLLILDVDGVFTDGFIHISDHGELFKSFNVQDGLGIKLLQRVGIEIGIITGRTSAIVQQRARELGITHVFQGKISKTSTFTDFVRSLHLTNDQVAYIGDDLPDLPCLKRAGLAITPANGHHDLEPFIHYRTRCTGGQGAIREVAEMLLKAQNHWPTILDSYME